MDFLSSIGSWCSSPGFFHGGGPGFGGWMPFHMGSLFQLLIIGLIVFFVARMFRKPAMQTAPTPEEILKRRYAAGEIDEQTYRAMKNDLS